MTFNVTIGWWLLPIAVMWGWLITMFMLGRLTGSDVVEFTIPFVVVTVMCLLTRFLP